MVLVTEGVTGLNVLESDQGDNVTGLCSVEFDTVIGAHLNDAANTLVAALAAYSIATGIEDSGQG